MNQQSAPIVLLSRQEVMKMFGGISPAGLYRGISSGVIPKPIKVGPRTNRWVESECHEALASRVAARDGGRAAG